MNFESVLIVTYGRSGSTLLQGLLNSIDGCLVRGENHDLCRGLFEAWQSLQNTKLKFGKGEGSLSPTSPWFGAAILNEEQFILDARDMVRRQLMGPNHDNGVSCLGFKEIRYLPPSQTNPTKVKLTEYLDFLAKLFPNPAFVILTRDHEQVANSAWWQDKKPEQVKKQLVAFEKEVGEYAKNKSWIYSINYDDMTKRTDRLNKMFAFLGAPFVEEKIEEVLNIKHSYTPKTAKNIKPVDIKIKLFESAFLLKLSIDKKKIESNVDLPFTISGAALPSQEASGKFKLVIKDKGGEHSVLWNLPSPKIGKMYPDSSLARNCRFKAEGIVQDGGSPIELYIVDNDNNHFCVAQIKQ